RGRIITDRLVPTYSVLDIAYDPLLLDPELDLHATAMVRDNTSEVDREVTLELLGTARETAPVLTSPGLGDTEVLNLLAFGDPVGGTASEDFLYAAAGQLLLSRQARRVGLDEFQLLSSGGVMGATIGEPSVRVGKYLDWPLSVWLRYEGLTRDMTTGQFEAEYRITNLLKIDARTNSDRGVYGVGIVLEKDF
ncbi:MAG: translocation/assembly module TamB domain-containing protein, partial [Candidatus Latescibacterota bacterium]|nr:translocation/assembly module TamB domain-containing protein [Candidatus Latescibacterota bacterium]